MPLSSVNNDQNTVCDVPRGRVAIDLNYTGDYVFADVRTGRRVARTGFYDAVDTAGLLGNILETLGFIPEITGQEIELM